MDRDHERMREAEAKTRQSQVLKDPHPVSDCSSSCGTDQPQGVGSYTAPVSDPTYRLRRRVDRLHAQSEASQQMAYQLSALLDCLPNRLPTGAADALNYLLSTAGF